MRLPESLRPLAAELNSNPRLRWGVWAIAGILWFYGVLVLRDTVPRQAEAYRAVARQLARTQAAASDTQWNARRDEALAVQAQLESRMWRANTVGLAQASFNDWLLRVAQQAAVQRPQIAVAAQEDDATGRSAGAFKVSARVTFDFTPQSFYPFMARLAAHDKSVVVESLAIRGAPTPRAEMVLLAYFMGSPGATTARAAPAGGKS